MAKPIAGEKLYLYLAASESMLSVVLFRAEGQDHPLIYFVNETLNDAELRYLTLEKLAYTLVMSVRKLCSYFFDHHIEILTLLPLWRNLHRPDTADWCLKCTVKISQFGVTFALHKAIKAQTLIDFMVELTFPTKHVKTEHQPWGLYVDGSSNNEQAGV